MGVKGDPQIKHDPCEQKLGRPVFFVRGGSMGQTIYEAPKEPEQSPQQLVVEAHRLLINIAAKDGSNFDRLEKLEEKAQERLFRRLDRLSGGVAPKPR
ncbi:MAG: hypothetical protein A2032_04030 [Chloroflexi bacterium RBG_19FT_COMBO_49_13]|nr:MAG: hypothetical protein A2032_04030 [Chloroflexi bacterium RBG_19FT_COMBO_49_13]